MAFTIKQARAAIKARGKSDVAVVSAAVAGIRHILAHGDSTGLAYFAVSLDGTDSVFVGSVIRLAGGRVVTEDGKPAKVAGIAAGSEEPEWLADIDGKPLKAARAVVKAVRAQRQADEAAANKVVAAQVNQTDADAKAALKTALASASFDNVASLEAAAKAAKEALAAAKAASAQAAVDAKAAAKVQAKNDKIVADFLSLFCGETPAFRANILAELQGIHNVNVNVNVKTA